MPSIYDANTRTAVVREYLATGKNKEQGLVNAGYTKSYARSGRGHKIYADKRIVAEIDKQVADLSKILEHDRTIAIKLLTDNLARLQSKADNGDIAAASAITACIRELNAISCLHSNTVITDDGTVEQLDKAEQEDRKAYTAWKLRQDLNIKRDDEPLRAAEGAWVPR